MASEQRGRERGGGSSGRGGGGEGALTIRVGGHSPHFGRPLTSHIELLYYREVAMILAVETCCSAQVGRAGLISI